MTPNAIYAPPGIIISVSLVTQHTFLTITHNALMHALPINGMIISFVKFAMHFAKVVSDLLKHNAASVSQVTLYSTTQSVWPLVQTIFSNNFML